MNPTFLHEPFSRPIRGPLSAKSARRSHTLLVYYTVKCIHSSNESQATHRLPVELNLFTVVDFASILYS